MRTLITITVGFLVFTVAVVQGETKRIHEIEARVGVETLPRRSVERSCPKQSFLKSLSQGTEDARWAIAGMNTPHAVTVDRDGTVFVANTWSDTIVRISSDGKRSNEWMLRDKGGQTAKARGIAVDPESGEVLVALTDTGIIQVLDKEGKLLRRLVPRDGQDSELKSPADIQFGPKGEILVADALANRVLLFDKKGNVTARIGSGKNFGAFRPRPEEAKLDDLALPHGAAISPNGEVFVADTYNRRVLRCDPRKTLVEGQCRIFAADIPHPYGVAFDENGDVYVTSYMGDYINRYDASGSLRYRIGERGSGNSQFACPRHLFIQGCTLYVADGGNNRISVIGPLIRSAAPSR